MTCYVLWPTRRPRAAKQQVCPREQHRVKIAASGRAHVARPPRSGLRRVVELVGTPTTTDGARTAPRRCTFAITDAGCDPSTAETTSGLVTFEVENKGAAGVTELEVIKDKRILGEVENLADGLNGHFSLTLQPGDYELYCPNGTTQERGTLTVTGETVASDDNAAAAQGDRRLQGIRDRPGGAARAAHDRVHGRRPRRRRRQGEEALPDRRASRTSASSRSPSRSATSIPQIDARAGDVPAATWTGFHRLEKMLWVDNVLRRRDEAVRRQARHRRRQARRARQDGRLPDRADRERREEPDGRDRRLEGDRRGGSLLAHRSLRLQGQRRRRQGRLQEPCSRSSRSAPRHWPPRSRTHLPIWTMPWRHSASGAGWVHVHQGRRRRPARPLAHRSTRSPFRFRTWRPSSRNERLAEPAPTARARGRRRRRGCRGRQRRQCSSSGATTGATTATAETVPFYGRHQAGILTPQQHHLRFASYDLTASNGDRGARPPPHLDGRGRPLHRRRHDAVRRGRRVRASGRHGRGRRPPTRPG